MGHADPQWPFQGYNHISLAAVLPSIYDPSYMPCNVSLRSLKLVPRGGSLVQHNRTINHVAIDPRPDLALLQRHPGLDDQKG